MTTNRTGWSQSSGTTPYINTTETMYAQYFAKINVTGWWDGTENYTGSSQTYYVAIQNYPPTLNQNIEGGTG